MKKILLSSVVCLGLFNLGVYAQTLAPDGSYTGGGNSELAPDGSYVGGNPELAPDGTYTGE